MNPEYIAALGPTLYLGYAQDGMVGMTHNQDSAERFKTRPAAWAAIDKAQKLRPGQYRRAFVRLYRPQAAREES